jgi:hypothetical protein
MIPSSKSARQIRGMTTMIFADGSLRLTAPLDLALVHDDAPGEAVLDEMQAATHVIGLQVHAFCDAQGIRVARRYAGLAFIRNWKWNR